MRVTTLLLQNLRAITRAQLTFQPGMNLLVGVNGVGKSTVLDALRVSLSFIARQANGLRLVPERFDHNDIRVGSEFLCTECEVQIQEQEYRFRVFLPREAVRLQPADEFKRAKNSERNIAAAQRNDFSGSGPGLWTSGDLESRPLALFYSTRRAIPSEKSPSQALAAGSYMAAFAEAMVSSELRLQELSHWLRAQAALAAVRSEGKRSLEAIEDAVGRFLPEYSNLRADPEPPHLLLVDRGNSTLEVRRLSDGERGTLAIVLDLTRRLAQANPHLERPAMQAEAVVLIDELDLHLHPRWQREICKKLVATFPRCQFIATTHSPQIIGEVEPNCIQILTAEGSYSPAQSFGVDSSRILEEVMDTEPRTSLTGSVIKRISDALAIDDYPKAKDLLHELEAVVGEDDPEVIRTKVFLSMVE